MKLKTPKLMIISNFIAFISCSATALADLQSDSNLIFDWAEKQYSSTLTPATSTKTTQFQSHSWYFRYYASDNLYLAINEQSKVYLYYGNTGQLKYINEASVFLEQINEPAITDNSSNTDSSSTTDGSSSTDSASNTDGSSGTDSSTNTSNSSESTCHSYLDAFKNLTALVDVSCSEEQLSINSATGLPALKNSSGQDQVMTGITAWINRVPIPYEYNWQIPTAPTWQSNSIEATAKGPIAVAINGVPIFHYERRPDVSTSLANYTAENDTVVQGELDHCGGHSGQGDDYHYHYTPVCLLEDHDLSQPIAFGLDGAPVYYGEGGTDYYGLGQFNDWNNFPDGIDLSSLDECNALANGDGSYVHYTTKQPPYVVGCHHAFFDSSLQIEPRPLEGREQGLATPLGGEFGEPVSTQITAFVLNDDGSYQMEFNNLNNSTETSSVIYRKSTSTENCWEFEFRENKEQTGEMQIACRNTSAQPPSSGQGPAPRPRILPVHNHTH